jgi:hypothetical protein
MRIALTRGAITVGYTHYFQQFKSATEDQWERIANDVTDLIHELPDHSESAGGSYANETLVLEEQVVITRNSIEFNGKLDHEPFLLIRDELDNPSFSSCKTARKPYDLVVCGALIVAHHHAPGVWSIFSDGVPDDWRPAAGWVQRVLGKARVNDVFMLTFIGWNLTRMRNLGDQCA